MHEIKLKDIERNDGKRERRKDEKIQQNIERKKKNNNQQQNWETFNGKTKKYSKAKQGKTVYHTLL